MTLDALADDVVTGALVTAVLLGVYWISQLLTHRRGTTSADAARRERLHRKSSDRGKF